MSYKLEYHELRVTEGGRSAFYKLALIIKPSGLAVLLKQWGKIGTRGMSKMHTGSALLMRAERDSIYANKSGKGYIEYDARGLTKEDPNEINDFIVRQGFIDAERVFDLHELSDIKGVSEEFFEALSDTEPAPEPTRPPGWGDW